jgi:two-component system sensor kinase FixL
MAQLASALAHEVNQPLTAIGNYLQAARRFMTASGLAPGDRVVEALDKAAAQTERAGQVVRTMRAFVKKGDGARSPEPLNTAIEEACALAMAGLGDLGVRMSFDLAHGLPDVLIDKVPVQQVIVNLVRNAAEAMRDSDRRELTIRDWLAANGRVAVEIRDTGPGLAPEVSAQLFQPFVTTKASGMGMGLSICRSIVNSHGGSIRAEAVAEGGTRFVFDLPAVEETSP